MSLLTLFFFIRLKIFIVNFKNYMRTLNKLFLKIIKNTCLIYIEIRRLFYQNISNLKLTEFSVMN
ncbi:MAG: hypothetical protein ACJAYY_001034 [Paraglaciecola sp.]|jgi:hypothetical protein